MQKPDNNELEESIQHQKDSEDSLSLSRERYLNYESMLLGEHREAIQNENKIFDPRVSTIEIERTARVASQRPSGKAFAVSKNDTGKNMIMNLLLNYQMDNANEQWDFIIKQMMWSFWSRVYGQMYALTPWRVRPDYIGNELFLINIYDAFPQPNVTVQDADWFIVGNRPTIQWLKAQDAEVWNMDEIKELANDLKNGEGEVKTQDNQTSYSSQIQFPTQKGDSKFPRVQTFTEYRGDKWITWAKRVNTKKGREYLLRTVENNDLEGKLPVVAKYSIPMFEGNGLGPFQRGKSLQFATNSILNMKAAEWRERLRPQLMIDPSNAVMSTIKYDPGAYWFMKNPGKDVVPFEKGGSSDAAFQQAYGVMVSAMLNSAGTTDTSNSQQIESALGKTPAALKAQAAAQQSQDFWEQTMMESSMKQVMERWIMQTVKNLEAKQALRLFEDEIQAITEQYPDAVDMFSEKSGQITVDKSFFTEDEEPVKFDYKIETGSTAKPNLEQQVADVAEILNLVDEKPALIAKMQAEGSDVSATQLFKEMLTLRGMRTEKIIVPFEQPMSQQADPAQMAMQDPMAQMQQMPQEMPQPEPIPQYEDPDINSVAQELMGGLGGIPSV
tara:strand:- start:22675 stop:24510 length:1836 start_codon:yes stop_codon:yes gene_type:complete